MVTYATHLALFDYPRIIYLVGDSVYSEHVDDCSERLPGVP